MLPNDEQDSRIILTTRKTDLALNACTEFTGEVYNMEPLSDKQSWELFCMKTFKDNSCPLNLEKICRSIFQKCEGQPLAIVAVSGILATKGQGRIDEWHKVCRSLHGNNGLNILRPKQTRARHRITFSTGKKQHIICFKNFKHKYIYSLCYLFPEIFCCSNVQVFWLAAQQH